jgi:hypothetical protein
MLTPQGSLHDENPGAPNIATNRSRLPSKEPPNYKNFTSG